VDALHPSQPKKKAAAEGAIIVYTDEASFRQTPTLCRTWAPRGCQPEIGSLGERNTQKILGAVSVPEARFVWRHQTEYFNASTYLAFLEDVLLPGFYRRGHRVYMIQDNASYHKKPEVYEWLAKQRHRIEACLLPPYSPEFNATERIWYYTRHEATHNRYFDTPQVLCSALFDTFADIQEYPQLIAGLVAPFFN
jgi:transposase